MPAREPCAIQRELRIQAGAAPITGTLGARHGPPRPFHGWLELWTAIEEIQTSAGVDDGTVMGDAAVRIIAAADAARRQLERDIYTGAQQDLVLIQPRVDLALRTLERDPAAAAALIADALEDLRRGLSALRDLAQRIYPAVLDSDGLVAALEQAVGRAAIPARLEASEVPRPPSAVEASIYFCCLEALQNAADHAGAGAGVTIRLYERGGELCFEVADDGCGFDLAGARPGRGLRNIEDRMDAMGGTLRVDSAPGEGTRLCGRVALATVPSPRDQQPAAPAARA